MTAQITPWNITSLQSRYSSATHLPVVMYSTGLPEHVTTSALWTRGHLSFKWILVQYNLNFGHWPGSDAFRPTAHQHNMSHQQGAHLVKHIHTQIWADAGVQFYSFMYRGAYFIIIIIIIIIIFLHGLGRLTCSSIDELPSFPGACTVSSSSRFVVEGVFRQSGVVHSFRVVDPVLFVSGSHALYSRDL
jgi:hypothetical protein